MSPMEKSAPSIIANIMKERSSVRKYQVGKEVPKETLDKILTLATTAPSSWNLQHWKFIVIQNEDNKKRLYPIAYEQDQIVDSSVSIIVLGDVCAHTNNVDKVYSLAYQAGNITEEEKSRIVNHILESYKRRIDRNDNFGVHEAIKNASFAAMQLMLAAKAYNVDTCPIGGFDSLSLRKKFNIPNNYVPVLILTLGYSEKHEPKSIRLPLDEVIINESF